MQRGFPDDFPGTTWNSLHSAEESYVAVRIPEPCLESDLIVQCPDVQVFKYFKYYFNHFPIAERERER